MTPLDLFTQVYADSVIEDGLSRQEWRSRVEASYEVRDLNWRGLRAPLAEVAKLYTAIVGSYNNFTPDMPTKLSEAFSDSGIEAAPAREGSVCIYLWIPDEWEKRVKKFISEEWEADEVDDQKDGSLRVWWD